MSLKSQYTVQKARTVFFVPPNKSLPWELFSKIEMKLKLVFYNRALIGTFHPKPPSPLQYWILPPPTNFQTSTKLEETFIDCSMECHLWSEENPPKLPTPFSIPFFISFPLSPLFPDLITYRVSNYSSGYHKQCDCFQCYITWHWLCSEMIKHFSCQ